MFNTPITTYEGWGVDPAYMTPAYMANFRPQYGGNEDGRNPYANHRPFGSNFNHAFGFADKPLGADPMHQANAARDQWANAGGDGVMSGLQSVAIPAATWYAASRFSKQAGAFSNRAATRGMRMATGGAGFIASNLPGGSRIASSAMATSAARGLAMGAGGVAGLAGSFMLPIMAAQAVSSGIDSAIFDPYVSTRRGTDALKANSANQYFGGGAANASGGFGISNTRAVDIAKELTIAGAQDYTLETSDYNKLADFGMRAGMFNEIGNMDTKRIVDAVKKMGSTVKTIVALTGDPDIQAAIETMAKLKAGGIDDMGRMDSVMRQLGGASAASGTSIKQIMDTVGTQGMMMAQQQGLQGTVGLLASADAYAGFTNARKTGLISGAQMASLGGAEGMTQNVMQGAMQMLDDPYGMMTAIGGGKFGQSAFDAINSFGQASSRDPMGSFGNYLLNGNNVKQQILAEHGAPGVILQGLMGKIEDNPTLDGKNPAHIMAMGKAMGLSPEIVRSALLSDKSLLDGPSRLKMFGALETKAFQTEMTKLDDAGLGLRGVSTLGIGAAQQYKKRASTYLVGVGAGIGNTIAEIGADIADVTNRISTSAAGFKLPEDITFRVASTKEGYRDKQYSWHGQKTINGWSGEEKIKTAHSSKWGATMKRLAALKKLNVKGSGKLVDELMEILSQDKPTAASSKRAEEIFLELDKLNANEKTGMGGLTDKDNKFERYNVIDSMRKGMVDNQEVKTVVEEVVSLDTIKQDHALRHSNGLSVEEGGLEIMGAIFDAQTDNKAMEKLVGEWGVAKKSMSQALRINNADMAKIDKMSQKDRDQELEKRIRNSKGTQWGSWGAEIKNIDDLRGRLYSMTGGDYGLVEHMLANQDEESMINSFNRSGDRVAQLREFIGNGRSSFKATKAYKSQVANAELRGIRTDGVQDIGMSIENAFEKAKWGQRIDDNTAALNANTLANGGEVPVVKEAETPPDINKPVSYEFSKPKPTQSNWGGSSIMPSMSSAYGGI